jgi:hypothetical protein
LDGIPLPFALAVVATLIIWFGVDMEKGRRDAEAFSMTNEPDESPDVLSGESTSGIRDSSEIKME